MEMPAGLESAGIHFLNLRRQICVCRQRGEIEKRSSVVKPRLTGKT
jgi:hypothetical protein